MKRSIEAQGSPTDAAEHASFRTSNDAVPKRARVISPHNITPGESTRPRVRSINRPVSTEAVLVRRETPPPVSVPRPPRVPSASQEQEPAALTASLSEPIYDSPAEREYLVRYAGIMDASLSINRVPTDAWESDAVIEDTGDGSKAVNIPDTFRPWHVPAVVRSLDEDTFAERPDRASHPQEKLERTGVLMQQVGQYLGERVDTDISRKAVVEIYGYGKALQAGQDEAVAVEDVTRTKLTPEQTAEVDAFFGFTFPAPDEEGHDPEAQEQTRKATLTRFFSYAEKAAQGSTRHAMVVDRVVDKYLRKPRNQPEMVLETTLMERGREKILTETGKDGWKHVKPEHDHMFNGPYEDGMPPLSISDIFLDTPYVHYLEEARADNEGIAAMELAVVDSIQQRLEDYSIFKRNESASYPAGIIEQQQINCVGASMIGSGLMTEVGINHLVASIPAHSVTVVLTDDGKVHWRDILNPVDNRELTDIDVQVYSNDGKLLQLADLAALSRDDAFEGITMKVVSDEVKALVNIIDDTVGTNFATMHLYPPLPGLKEQMMTNFHNSLFKTFEHGNSIAVGDVVAQQALKSETLAFHWYMVSAYRQMYEGNVGEAESLLATSIAKNIFNPGSRIDRASTRSRFKNFDGAMEDINNVLADDPDNARALHTRAEINFAQKDYAAARTDIAHLLILEPQNVQWLTDFGELCLKDEMFLQAGGAFGAALQVDPENKYLIFSLGRAYYGLKEYDTAIKLYTHLIKEAQQADMPEDSSSYYI